MLDEGIRREWVIPEGFEEFTSDGLWLGTGDIPLEIRVAKCDETPKSDRVGSLWKTVQGRRPAPMLLIVKFTKEGRCAVYTCGPTGENPPVRRNLSCDFVFSVSQAALETEDRHAGAALLETQLSEGEEEHPGITNTLIARHVLAECLNSTKNKTKYENTHPDLKDQEGRGLVKALGYDISELTNSHHLLKTNDQRTAVAVFLDRSESFDSHNQRFGRQTPIASALSQAKSENVDFVVAVKEQVIRIYPTEEKRGAALQARHDSYLEANLALLPSQNLWQLPKLFGAEALLPEDEGGCFSMLLTDTERYTHQLGEKLRKRIYEHVVPKLANLMAGTADTTEKLTREQLDQLYQTALTILFRLLFIAYSEDQDLLPYQQNPTYRAHSLKTIAKTLANRANQTKEITGLENGLAFEANSTQYWTDVCDLFRAVDKGNSEWGVPAYNGGLFSADEDINLSGVTIKAMEVNNQQIGPVLFHLLIDQVSEGGDWGPVDFRQLAAREFGTIYEGLLEAEMVQAETDLTTNKQGHYLPAKEDDEVVKTEGEIFLLQQSGIRKSTGTYFTPKFAVDHLLEHSLKPAVEEHLQRIKELLPGDKHQMEAAERFFQFRVADIAMGSGHFLTAAIDVIAEAFTEFLQDHPIKSVMMDIEELRMDAEDKLSELNLEESYEIDDLSLLRRLIARHCIYGVDINPFAVDLARLAIWTHTFVPGLPLSFLDHNLICGDSLIGIGTLDEALEHDLEKMEIVGLTRYLMEQYIEQCQPHLQQLAQLNDATPAQIEQAREAQQSIKKTIEPLRKLLNVLVAHRVIDDLVKFDLNIDEEAINNYPDMDRVDELDRELNPVHFPIAFPEVFTGSNPGFHCIVGNPPWEKVKIEEHAWWATYYPGIRGLSNVEMNRQITVFKIQRPDLLAQFLKELNGVKRLKELIKQAPYHPKSSGDTDTYKAFSWRYIQLALYSGKFGIVLPGGSLGGQGNRDWRRSIVSNGRFIDITRINNRKGWFHKTIHPQYSICLICAEKSSMVPEFTVSGPLMSRTEWMNRESVTLTNKDLQGWSRDLVIPSIQSCTHRDIYRKQKLCPVFDSKLHHWQGHRIREFDANKDKHLFVDQNPNGYWPVYKGASFYIWDPDTNEYYRFCNPKEITETLYNRRIEKSNKSKSPFYIYNGITSNTKEGCSHNYIRDKETLDCLYPRLCIREVCRSTDSRTVIIALIPANRVLVHSAPYLFFRVGDQRDEAFVLGVLSSIPLDWNARKVVDLSLSYALLKDLPIPNPDRGDPLRRRVEVIAGRMATKEKGHPGFKKWAEAVGVEEGSVEPEEEPELLAELDAVVAILYGLELDDLKFIYDTFHHTTDYSDRYQLAAKYWKIHTNPQ